MSAERDHMTPPSSDEELYLAIGRLAADAALSPHLFLRSLKSDVRATAHPRRALTSLHRFLLTGFSSAWLRDFHEHRLLQRILLEICAQSQFLADILVRNPELFRWLTSSIVLKITKTSKEYESEVRQAIGLFQRSEKKLDALKRFQRRELLRIGSRQILKEADVTTTSRELSALAYAIIEAVLELAYEQLGEGAGESEKRELAIIALGKLGGEELNFSSDIDLMFVYEKDGPLKGSQKRFSTLHEYYSRVSEYVVRRLSEHTGEGHLYRVDMRLRPDGFSGSLAMSRSAYVAYYESRGELWERQMLIKARMVAGDRSVGRAWRRDILPFVYPKTLLSSPLDEISKIKSKIESNAGGEGDIKLGSGGIRDIEFAVQALQLLNGGNNPHLQLSNTVQALGQLAESKLLKPSESGDLIAAYRFLRTVEDRLQLLHGLQKHSLPQETEERRILARQLGYGSPTAFSKELDYHRGRIRTIFRSVMQLQSQSDARGGRGVRRSRIDSSSLGEFGFLRPEEAQSQIQKIASEVPELNSASRQEAFLKLAQKHGAPDWCLKNFLLLASSGPIKRTVQQVLSSFESLDLILLLCSRSSRYASLLSQEPLLFEALIGRPEDLLSPGLGSTFLKSSDLTRFRKYNEFKSVLRFLLSESSIGELTRELTSLADTIIQDGFERACEDTPADQRIPISLIGLGKLGGNELSIGSDLDLILLYREGADPGVSKTANKVGRRFVELLEGVYDVDLRLRPEGKNAPLATGFDYYRKYLSERASLWERQSLVKARCVGGDAELGREVTEHIIDFTFHSPLAKSWKGEISTMRRRMEKERQRGKDGIDMKVGSGGLVDLEFGLQSIQLRLGSEKAYLKHSNSFEAAQSLRESRILKKSDVRKMESNLDYLRRLDVCVRMNSESNDFVLPGEGTRLQAIAAAMGTSSEKIFQKMIAKVRKENRALLNTILRRLPK